MRLYPDVPSLRTRTIAGDLAVLLALLLLIWLGVRVDHAVSGLVPVARGVTSAGTAVEGGFRSAADAVGSLPVVGGGLSGALKDAGSGTGGEAAAAGRDGETAIHRLATLLGWLTFLLPALLLLSRFGPPRVAQVRRLTAASRVLDHPDSPERHELLARRAAFGLPYAQLVRFTRDPLGDLAEGRHAALVAAALDDAGLRPRDPGAPAGQYHQA